jgi:hypothetical protein
MVIGLARLIRIEKINNAQRKVFENNDVFLIWVLIEEQICYIGG